MEVLLTLLIANHVHIEAQIGVKSDQSNALDFTQIVDELIEHLARGRHHHS